MTHPGARTPTVAGLVAVCGLLLAGCDDSGTTETAVVPDCSLAPGEFVSEHLGVEVKDPNVSGTGPFAICSYSTPDGTNVGLRFQHPASSADLDKEREGFAKAGAQVTDVAGLGDAAFSSTYTAQQAPVTTNTLAVYKGDTAVIISSQIPLDAIRNLMEALLAKL